MKEYVKPQMEIKSLIQTTAITADEEEKGTVTVSIPNSWWPTSNN